MKTVKFFGEVKLVTLRETPPSIQLDVPDHAAAYWRDVVSKSSWFSPDREQFVVLHLDTRCRVRGFALVGIGSLNAALCHARDVFRAAIVANANAVLLMHNHPSGDPSPSEQDISVTRDLECAGRLLGIELLDHLVIADDPAPGCQPWRSLRALGYVGKWASPTPPVERVPPATRSRKLPKTKRTKHSRD